LDDELFNLLCAPLPEGAKLTAIFDSCHSGSVLDLPLNYVLNAQGQLEQFNPKQIILNTLKKGGLALMTGHRGIATAIFAKGLKDLGGMVKERRNAPKEDGLKQDGNKMARGTIVQFSGCRDDR
jgi:metacaspase-1